MSLPNTYWQLDYIESSGTQYIDTGYCASDDIVIQTKFINLESTGAVIIGGGGSGESDTFRFFNYQNACYLDYGSGSGYNRINGGTISSNTLYELEIGNRYVKNLSTSVNIISADAVTFTTKTYDICVNGTTNSDSSKNKFYYIKIYDNNVLVRDYIPAMRKSDNAVGLYDLANDVFYTNAGSGEFTYGRIYHLPVEETDTEYEVYVADQDITLLTKNKLTNKPISINLDLPDASKALY